MRTGLQDNICSVIIGYWKSDGPRPMMALSSLLRALRAPNWRTFSKVTSEKLFIVMVFLCSLSVSDKYVSAQSENQIPGSSPCYDRTGRPQRCIPEFFNAAFNQLVEVTNTCGEQGQVEFCRQTAVRGIRTSCELCDGRFEPLSHPSSYLTDFNNNDNQTWWQSETMLEDIQYPTHVNLTLSLGKSFHITYIRLKFQSPRPESFAIYKRTAEDGPWIPYQYYSSSCRDTYSLPDQSYLRPSCRNRVDDVDGVPCRETYVLRPGDEAKALCTSDFSDISPLSGGSVAFSTLEGRPSAYDFVNNDELQEWVTATDIRIRLDRLNTFGDEVFRDPSVLKSYFYAISDFAVGGRCSCNGHASECVSSSSQYGQTSLVCRCRHNTAGPDCNECLPFYNDVPWQRARTADAYQCKPCNCNGYANRCYLDSDLYQRTGHGGHCLDCTANRDGPNCERCQENYYEREDGFCVPCLCSDTGSRSLQCSSEGKCQCEPGVTGDKCDRCKTNHYDLSAQGCKPCGCSVDGSTNNEPYCDVYMGTCQCKENVEGQRCDRCKPGFFDLNIDNEFGCTPCFCYGHSSICISAPGYSRVLIESSFVRGDERWMAEYSSGLPMSLAYNALVQNIGVSASGRDSIYFVAPDRFLGDQRSSYNHHLGFTLRIGELGPRATVDDIVLEGAGLAVSQPVFGQGNPLPDIKNLDYKFRLHENTNFGWNPRLAARDFLSVLSNLTAIKIRGTYTPQGVGFLDDVTLLSARRGGLGEAATWIEMCTCPDGYVGQFCESCAPGYHHEPVNGGPFARCVPCNCNGHADICEAETGRCICRDNTGGNNCELCARGYFGNALGGTTNDCEPCPCPGQGACIQLMDETVACLECPLGYAGHRCDVCTDGYFGDPTGQFGQERPCEMCDCNGNVDDNAVGNCNRTTGVCLKCVHNTAGNNCEECLPGYYGDSLALPKGNCQSCGCYPVGTIQNITEEGGDGPFICDQITGECSCKPRVNGDKCDKCDLGFWNILSGEGCEPCGCDLVGSLNQTCTIGEGQCFCRPGVVGIKCDECDTLKYGFSEEGCVDCDCDPIGSTDLQCDPDGQCLCRENVEGRQCERCMENKHDRQAGCKDCPACYNLVQDAVLIHRDKLFALQELLDNIANDPTIIDDLDFERRLLEVQARVEDLYDDARQISSGGASPLEQIQSLYRRIDEVRTTMSAVVESMGRARQVSGQGERNTSEAELVIQRARDSLSAAIRYLDTDGTEALQRAISQSEQFGQQSERMSEIARETRHLADQQEELAGNIEDIADDALGNSTVAYEVAYQVFEQQRNVSNEIRRLSTYISSTESLMEQTSQLAEEAHLESTDAYDSALNIYTEANSLNVPRVEVEDLRNEAQNLADQASVLKDEISELTDRNGPIMSDISTQLTEAEILLERGVTQQQIADELLADVDAALDKATNAVTSGERTLEEAQRTLETLQGFDRLVQESEDEAQTALQTIADITELILDAETKTFDARDALRGAEQDALAARDIAQEAQEVAEEASDQASGIRQEATQTRERAGELSDEATSLTAQLADTGERLGEYEDQVVADEALAQEALEKANQAKNNAGEATTRVRAALDTVNDILYALNSLSDVDTSQLDILERRLAQAELELESAGLEERLGELTIAQTTQNVTMKSYYEELVQLRIDVDNVEAIRDALPDSCYKRIRLEP